MTPILTTVLAAITFTLSPSSPYPDPNPPVAPNQPGVQLLPTYATNGDGTRMQCTPSTSYCWRDTTGLPSYLS
jgi:hypothetical protein